MGVSVTMTVSDFTDLIKQTVKETVECINNRADSSSPWLTPKQVCERLSINRATLWRWEKEGYISGVKFGNRMRYDEKEVARVESAEKKGGKI